MVHGCMVCPELAETAAVSRSTSHVTTKQRCKYNYTPLGWVFKARCIKLQSLIWNHMRQERSESTREWIYISIYISDQQQQQQFNVMHRKLNGSRVLS